MIVETEVDVVGGETDGEGGRWEENPFWGTEGDEEEGEVGEQADTGTAKVSEEIHAWIYDLLVEHLDGIIFKDHIAKEVDIKFVNTNEALKAICEECIAENN